MVDQIKGTNFTINKYIVSVPKGFGGIFYQSFGDIIGNNLIFAIQVFFFFFILGMLHAISQSLDSICHLCELISSYCSSKFYFQDHYEDSC